MSEKINDGGPAFPHMPEVRQSVGDDLVRVTPGDQPGMTLRDYFAAKAMQGILGGDHPITHDENPLPTIAHVAYEIADAMITERNKS